MTAITLQISPSLGCSASEDRVLYFAFSRAPKWHRYACEAQNRNKFFSMTVQNVLYVRIFFDNASYDANASSRINPRREVVFDSYPITHG
jgi:hypothetical protein